MRTNTNTTYPTSAVYKYDVSDCSVVLRHHPCPQKWRIACTSVVQAEALAAEHNLNHREETAAQVSISKRENNNRY